LLADSLLGREVQRILAEYPDGLKKGMVHERDKRILTMERLARFEHKNSVTSEHFIAEMAAEDLEGGGEEHVHWAGEYKIMERLREKLRQLQNIRYGDSTYFNQIKACMRTR